jgi:hypothetical protein
MGKPKDTSDGDERYAGRRPEPCVQCPNCGSSITKATIRSKRGMYCICQRCGHLWHEDQPDGI